MAEETQTDITALTVQLLSAYVSKNNVPSESLADLIKSTRAALTENPATAVAETAAETFTPAVSVRKSLASPDHILSLIDGKPYKTLKRHLMTRGLTPEQYRERYNLPKSYPLVAQSYSEARRAVAEKSGLGRKPADAAGTPKPAQTAPTPAAKLVAAPTLKAPKKAAAASAKAQPAKGKAASTREAASTVAEGPKPAAAKSTAPTKKVATAKEAAASKTAPVVSNRAYRAEAAPAAAKTEPRKRLSIAGPRDKKADAKVDAAPVAAESSKATPTANKAAAAPKAKSRPKPKSLKAALEAASTHLNTDAKAAEPASTQS